MPPNISPIENEFGLSSLSVNNKATVFVLTVIILILGLIAYTSMPKESFPEIVIAEIYIGTPHPGNSPADMENLITRPLEKHLKTIAGVDKITSTSIQDYSNIVIKFNTDIPVEEALRKVKDAVDKAKKDLPADLSQDPNIFELNFSEFPIMNINLSGDFSVDKLKKYGEYLEDEIEKLPEISKVDIRGAMEKEVKVEIDIHKLESLQLSFNDIAGAIANENRTMSGGNVKTDLFQKTLRIIGEFSEPSQLADIVVKNEKGNIVYLKDIANVSFDYEERKSYARENQKPVVMLDVVKRSGENMLSTSDKIIEILDEAKKNIFPSSLNISITNDMSSETRNQVTNLENNIIFGIILVVLVLMFFLGLRNALFVGTAIPLSMFMGFMLLGSTGVTLNMIVLFSLILALGMLVDNGIVVVENIYRHLGEGKNHEYAAKQGVGEVAVPIITSTLTTLAAFIPMAFWPGMMGEFMKYLPITLIIVLGSSLFVALVMNPVFTSVWMRIEEKPVNNWKLYMTTGIIFGVGLFFRIIRWDSLGHLAMITALVILINRKLLNPASVWFRKNVVPEMESFYHRFLLFALSGKKPYIFLSGTVFLFIFSFVLLFVFAPKVEFFPNSEPHYVNVFIEKPLGTNIEVTNSFTKEIEKVLSDLLSEYEVQNPDSSGKKYNFLVKSMIAQVGEGTSDPTQGPVFGVTPHKARITTTFVDYEYRRGVKTSEVLDEIRAGLKKFPGVQIIVDKDNNGPPVGKPISIEVSGKDFEKLIALSEKVRFYINQSGIAGIEELKTDLELGSPELSLIIDREKARRFGISTAQIAGDLRTSLFGLEVSRYKIEEDDYPINIRLDEKYRNDPEILINQRITFRDQTNGQIRQIPVSAVAALKNTSTYGSIRRKNLHRVVTISSNVLAGYNANEVVEKIKEQMNAFEIPKEFQLNFSGQQEEQNKEMSFLTNALLVALFLIFIIIVAQFNSVTTPLIIMTAVVLSGIGVLLGITIFRMDFIIIMTMIGIISLAGVVVNNVIVLIDYSNLLINRRKKESGLHKKDKLPIEEIKQCIINAGSNRLRPVLLTAITTVLGLLPLATGMNLNFFTLVSSLDPQIYFGGDNVIFWGPMSWTVIFGLSFATFLTLIIVPVMYYLLNKVFGLMGK